MELIKSCPLLIAAPLILVATSFHYQVSVVSRNTIVDIWQPIKDPNAPHVVEIAKFVVPKYNRNMHTKLEYVKMVKGESQVVEGMNYRLVFTANDAAAGNTPGNYEAVVWDKPWEHFMQLTSFAKL